MDRREWQHIIDFNSSNFFYMCGFTCVYFTTIYLIAIWMYSSPNKQAKKKKNSKILNWKGHLWDLVHRYNHHNYLPTYHHLYFNAPNLGNYSYLNWIFKIHLFGCVGSWVNACLIFCCDIGSLIMARVLWSAWVQ